MSGPITFTGLFSGIDTQSIIEQLLTIERMPLDIVEQRQAETQEKLEIFQDLSTRLAALDSSVQTLNLSSTVGAKTATSSDSDVLGVSASSTASEGAFTINSITTLAAASSEASIGVVSSSDSFVSGSSFSFDVGTTEVSITLDDSQKTLTGLRDAINDATDEAAATILDTGDPDDPYKLIISSSETGTDNAISNISTDIKVTTSTGTADLTFSTSVTAADAQFSVNGVSITRSSNTASDVVEGVTLTLKDESASAITVTVAPDTEPLKTAIEDFIEKYNEVNSLIQAQFALDEETGTAGLLSGDATLRHIQSTLQQNVVAGVTDAEGNRHSMGSVGIDVDKYTGELSLDETRFNAAAADEDLDLFFDVFLAHGAASDSRVTFVGSTHDTEAGTYSINVSGYDGEGNVQGTFTKNGDVYTGVGNGQYLVGPSGTDAEDLRIRIASGATGDLGEVVFTVGAGERLERSLDDLITPIVGLLPELETRLENDILDLDDQIEAFEARLAERERELLLQFIAAEQAIATLQNQTSTFEQAFGTLSGQE